jgi:hypothetical protein
MDKLHNMTLGKSQDTEEFFAKFDIPKEEVGYEGDQYNDTLIRILRKVMPERIREKVDYHIPRITTYDEWKTMALEMDGIWRSIQGKQTFPAPKPTMKPGARPLPKLPFGGVAPKA